MGHKAEVPLISSAHCRHMTAWRQGIVSVSMGLSMQMLHMVSSSSGSMVVALGISSLCAKRRIIMVSFGVDLAQAFSLQSNNAHGSR